MQPYFIPYLGYYQLIHAVDEFIILDDVEFSKGGWYNRNNILIEGKKHLCTLPIKKPSVSSLICTVDFTRNIELEKKKTQRKIVQAYAKSPFFNESKNIIEQIFDSKEHNLTNFNVNALKCVCYELGINTKISLSSDLEIQNKLRGVERVLEICAKKEANSYINSIGGVSLYNKSSFKERNIKLNFIKMHDITYNQNHVHFVSNLSIVDTLFFNGLEGTKKLLDRFDLI